MALTLQQLITSLNPNGQAKVAKAARRRRGRR